MWGYCQSNILRQIHPVESVYLGEYSARIIATAAIAFVRGQSQNTIQYYHRAEELSCIEVMLGLLDPTPLKMDR